jgi:hypothetical protein
MNPRAHAIKTHQIVLTPDKSDNRKLGKATLPVCALIRTLTRNMPRRYVTGDYEA